MFDNENNQYAFLIQNKQQFISNKLKGFVSLYHWILQDQVGRNPLLSSLNLSRFWASKIYSSFFSYTISCFLLRKKEYQDISVLFYESRWERGERNIFLSVFWLDIRLLLSAKVFWCIVAHVLCLSYAKKLWWSNTTSKLVVVAWEWKMFVAFNHKSISKS